MAILGNNVVGPSSTVFPYQDDKSGSVFTLAADSNAGSLTFYAPADGTAKVKGLIYAASGGIPGALVGATPELVGTVAGWNTINFSSLVALTAGEYWLGIISDTSLTSTSGTVSAPGGHYNADIYSDGPADPFGGSYISGILKAVYVTLVSGGISIGNGSIIVAGQALGVDSPAILFPGSGSITVSGQSLSYTGGTRIISPGSGQVVLNGKSFTLINVLFLSIPSGSISMSGSALLSRTLSNPEFDIEEIDDYTYDEPTDEYNGFWLNGQSSDPSWGFSEQQLLPIPYHKDPIKAEVCGHWHKYASESGEGSIPVPEVCIEYVAEAYLADAPADLGWFKSSDSLIYSGGYLYAAGLSDGYLTKINPDSLKIACETLFDPADINSIRQIAIYNGVIHALINRDGYVGCWLQQVAIPADGEDFTLIGEPLYAGNVITGSDGNLYGLFTDDSWVYFSDLVPITGAYWEDLWERIPNDYSYYVGTYTNPSCGAAIVNFRILPGPVYALGNGPSSSFLIHYPLICLRDFTGRRTDYIPIGMANGPNEMVVNKTKDKIMVLRCTSAAGNLTCTTANISNGHVVSSADTLVTGLEDANGDPYDGTIYHHRTIYHGANDRIYSLHATYPNSWGRIIALDSDGTLLHQYVIDGTSTGLMYGSFCILGDYVYMWQDEMSPSGSISSVIKLTLDLEFVCIEECLGGMSGAFPYTEVGRAIVSDGNEYLYNYAQHGPLAINYPSGPGLLTKWRTNPVVPEAGYFSTSSKIHSHNPVWEFTKAIPDASDAVYVPPFEYAPLSGEVIIPGISEWSAGVAVTGLQFGPSGAWDDNEPSSITPCKMIKIGSTYYMYYIGSDGPRTTDGGPAHRKLGVATSSNAVNWVKYPGNPIMEHSIAGNQEEGIFGCTVLQHNGLVYLYITAIEAGDATTESVEASVKVAWSSDGINFTTPTEVLGWYDSTVIGYGDELGIVGAVYTGGKFILYYFAKGTYVGGWRICAAVSIYPTLFSGSNTRLVINEENFYGCGGDVIKLSETKHAMFFQKRSNWGRMEVWAAENDKPFDARLVQQADGFLYTLGLTVFLDTDAGLWRLYNRDYITDTIWMRTAPITYR